MIAFLKRKVNINYHHLRFLACVYIGLPLLLFFCGYMKWYFALVAVAATAFGMYCAISSPNVEARHDHTMQISFGTIGLVFLVTLVWSYLGGLNGYFYQSSDWNCRNAIYWDLIRGDWPVHYSQNGGALSYYIGHWIPPAVAAKVFYWSTDSFELAQLIGRFTLWIWSCIGLTIVLLLIFHFLNATTKKKKIFAALVFIFFSGLDLLGGVFRDNLDFLFSEGALHLEWWTQDYQFTSITACVYWVFNQTIIPWIITLCFLMEKDARNYVFYCVACLLCGPFPCLGLAICMIVKTVFYGVNRLRKNGFGKALKAVFRTVFSPANACTFMLVFPFVAAYILTNDAFGAISTSADVSAGEVAVTKAAFFSAEYWTRDLILFLVMDAGIYLSLLFIDHKRNPMFYTIAAIFLLAPYFHVGVSIDFCMRVSVPAIFILMLYVSEFLQKHLTIKPADFSLTNKKKMVRQVAAWILLICFLIGSATPIVEVYRGIYHVVTKGTIFLEDNSIGTFNSPGVPFNFGCSNPEDTIFFKWFAIE